LKDKLNQHRRSARRICTASAFLGVVLFMIGPAFGQDVLGGLTLGAFLNKALDQVDQAIVDARNSGNAVAVEAGRETALAIQNAENAYSDQLNKTADQLNNSVLKTAGQIKTLTDDIANKTNMTVDMATTRAQAIVNTLPFSNKEPQVTSFAPRYVVPKDGPSNNLEIDFLGNFPNSSRPGYQAYLKAGGKMYQAHNTTNKLTFLVPQSALFSDTAARVDKLQYADASLVVPWLAPRFFSLMNVRREDQYNVLVGSLPSSPGEITVLHTVSGTNPATKPFCSGNMHQCSTRENVEITTTSRMSGWCLLRMVGTSSEVRAVHQPRHKETYSFPLS